MKKRSAFTLIELLVTVAIIALLASMLLPSMARAKAAAHLSLCRSNLKQLGLALQLYVGDHQAYPVFGGLEPANFYWYDKLFAYTSSPWTKALYKCPSYHGTTEPGTYEPNRFGGVQGSYGYNAFGATLADNSQLGLGPLPLGKTVPPISEQRVVAPSEMIAIGDARYYALAPPGPTFDESRAWAAGLGSIYSWPRPSSSIARRAEIKRHSAQSNFVFCDDHVETIKVSKLDENSESFRRRWNNDHEPH